MFKRHRSTGNWAEDMGNDIGFMLKVGVGAVLLVPVLLLTILVLVLSK